MTKKMISEYYSDDMTKRAVIQEVDGVFAIDFYENERYNHSILYTDKALNYVEDAAENYVEGFFTNIRDY